MATMDVSVPDPMRDWVEARVNSGQYASASDYVRDLIRRDQVDAEEREALVAALIKGEESSVSQRSVPDIIASVKARLANAHEVQMDRLDDIELNAIADGHMDQPIIKMTVDEL